MIPFILPSIICILSVSPYLKLSIAALRPAGEKRREKKKEKRGEKTKEEKGREERRGEERRGEERREEEVKAAPSGKQKSSNAIWRCLRPGGRNINPPTLHLFLPLFLRHLHIVAAAPRSPHLFRPLLPRVLLLLLAASSRAEPPVPPPPPPPERLLVGRRRRRRRPRRGAARAPPPVAAMPCPRPPLLPLLLLALALLPLALPAGYVPKWKKQGITPTHHMQYIGRLLASRVTQNDALEFDVQAEAFEVYARAAVGWLAPSIAFHENTRYFALSAVLSQDDVFFAVRKAEMVPFGLVLLLPFSRPAWAAIAGALAVLAAVCFLVRASGHDGFYGELCNKCIALPGCQHGYCNTSFECICDEGWDGLFCSERQSDSFSLSNIHITRKLIQSSPF
ncbi:Delta-like protein, partial [Gryllus bimaculatus]